MSKRTPNTPLPPFGPAPLKGALWMALAAALLATLSVLVRYVSDDLHPFQTAFVRNGGQLAFMLPWIAWRGIGVMKSDRVKIHAFRSVAGTTAMLLWFSALSLTPVAKATALSFTSPLFGTIGAALILRETVRLRRWGATAIGFLGMLVILRPGMSDMSQGEMMALAAAAFIAASMLFNKSLSRTEHPTTMVAWMGVFMTIFTLPFALTVWVWPTAETWGVLALLSAVATGVHLCINRAFASAEASAIFPLGFLQLPVAAIMGFVIFGEVVDGWTWAGALVIFSSSFYIARREAKLARAKA